MKYYIIDYMGNVLGEFTTKEKAENILESAYTKEQIEKDELEIIEG